MYDRYLYESVTMYRCKETMKRKSKHVTKLPQLCVERARSVSINVT